MTAHEHGLCAAFLYGWRDGYECGKDNCPFVADDRRHAYRVGYDRGIAEYCTEKEAGEA